MNCGCPNSEQTQGPQPYDFSCVAGNDFSRQLQLVDPITKQPITSDITLWSFYMAVYASWSAKSAGDDPLIYIDTALENFPIVSNVSKTINMLISKDQTSTIAIPDSLQYGMDVPQNVCVFDLVGVDENGFVQTEMRGTFTFQQGLTVIA